MYGKGIFIWQIAQCSGGDPEAIAQKAVDMGLNWVAIKIANGTYPYNFKNRWPLKGVDLVPPLVAALRNKSISVHGWHYVYGDFPKEEARIAIERVKSLSLDGYIIDAEAEYKGKHQAARTFMALLRDQLPTVPIALCSYRFPHYHRELPWMEFLNKCDIHMPQVYWQGSHNPGYQLELSVNALKAKKDLPVVPVGAAYTEHGWTPTIEDLDEFHNKALELSLSGITWWSWQHMEQVPEMWLVIASQFWEPVPPIDDPPPPEEPPPAEEPPPGKIKTRVCNLAQVTAFTLNIRAEPKYGTKVFGQLTQNSIVAVSPEEFQENGNIWLEIPGVGFIAKKYGEYTFAEYLLQAENLPRKP